MRSLRRLATDTSISSQHCRIYLDEEDGTPCVADFSANGTFVNGVRVGKGNVETLKNFDEISLLKPVVLGGTRLCTGQDVAEALFFADDEDF